MQPNNLTNLDFADIRASIVSYLRTRPEFSDYEFEGSTLSYLIDILAYNTYYGSFTANMMMNESFLQTATVRDNIVKHAKLLNYIPKSPVASRANFVLEVNTTLQGGVYPSTVTLRRGACINGGGFVWNVINDITAEVDPSTGIANFAEFEAKEGAIITYEYIVNTFTSQVYTIPTPDCDTTTLVVRVKANESATKADVYNRVDNVTSLAPTDRIYFLSEGQDQRFEIQFGDDVSGRSLKDGEIIQLSYLVTNGADANDINKFTFVGRVRDNFGTEYNNQQCFLTKVLNGYGGSAAESVESIKYNASRFYASQYRAVTAEDYAIITKKVYDNADAVVAYGGDLLNPPIYGKVFIAIRTRTGGVLNDATKKSISADLRKFAMASIDPVIVDPEEMFIYAKSFVQYDTGAGLDSTTIKTSIQNSILQWQEQSGINAFNSTFRAQAFRKAVIASSKGVIDVSLQISIVKYLTPVAGSTNSYSFTTGSALYDSAPSLENDGMCTKEPILLSGKFRTADRPGIDQQFEDDGFGNIVTFYNTGTKKVITNAKAGTVDYTNGNITFGPVSVIASGANLPQDGAVLVTDSITGVGRVIDSTLLPGGLKIPVQLIPANPSSIPAATPGTTIDIISPDVTVRPNGSTPPPAIPLNSLTPTVFDQTETIINLDSITNSGSLNS